MILEKPNLDVIEELSFGDADVKQELIAIIKEEFPIEYALYLELLEKKEYIKLKEIVHKLKNKISTLGMSESYALANKFEHNILDKDLGLADQFNTILERINLFINTI